MGKKLKAAKAEIESLLGQLSVSLLNNKEIATTLSSERRKFDMEHATHVKDAARIRQLEARLAHPKPGDVALLHKKIE
jgi:hypothetical protein